MSGRDMGIVRTTRLLRFGVTRASAADQLPSLRHLLDHIDCCICPTFKNIMIVDRDKVFVL